MIEKSKYAAMAAAFAAKNLAKEKADDRLALTAGSPSSAHDNAWEKGFILPIAKEMKARGVAYLLITIRDDGKAAYVLEPNEPECLKCAQNGWSNERNGPCPKFPNCAESFPENVTTEAREK